MEEEKIKVIYKEKKQPGKTFAIVVLTVVSFIVDSSFLTFSVVVLTVVSFIVDSSFLMLSVFALDFVFTISNSFLAFSSDFCFKKFSSFLDGLSIGEKVRHTKFPVPKFVKKF